MFSDQIVNRGRFLVLTLYTEALCLTLEPDTVQHIRAAYWTFISELKHHGRLTSENDHTDTQKSP